MNQNRTSGSKIALIDVVIVGGGVAGSTTAIVLRHLGLSVALVEREAIFRDRIRGETIHPWGATVIRELGLYDDILAATDANEQRFWQTYRERTPSEPYRWANDFPAAPNGLGIRHVDLQNALIALAERAGVQLFRPATATYARQSEGIAVRIDGPDPTTELRTRLLVGADGPRSAVRSWIGGSTTRDQVHHAIGGAYISDFDAPADRVHQAFFEGGFTLASPLANNTARVYLVCGSEEADRIRRASDSASAYLEKLTEAFPEGMLQNATSLGPLGFFPNANVVANISSGQDVVLVGDAAGTTDPCQGHGISMAFLDGASLRNLVELDTPWSEIPDVYHAQHRSRFDVICEFSRWQERLSTETGPEIDQIRDCIALARRDDPTGGGFASILATGPANLVTDDDARAHYFGEDLRDSLVVPHS